MKKAFTLVELLITVAILGILAAIVLPIFQYHITEAREASAKDNLRILRNAIELYATQHDDVPPGYPYNDPSLTPAFLPFTFQLVRDGHYLSELPQNPFNEESSVRIISDSQDFPSEPAGTNGWIYKPLTKEIRLDWPGTDSAGVAYFDY